MSIGTVKAFNNADKKSILSYLKSTSSFVWKHGLNPLLMCNSLASSQFGRIESTEEEGAISTHTIKIGIVDIPTLMASGSKTL